MSTDTPMLGVVYKIFRRHHKLRPHQHRNRFTFTKYIVPSVCPPH